MMEDSLSDGPHYIMGIIYPESKHEQDTRVFLGTGKVGKSWVPFSLHFSDIFI